MINLGLLTFGQKIILFFILLESIIVALFVVASYVAKIWLGRTAAQQNKKMAKIDAFINHPETEKTPNNMTLFFLALEQSNLSQAKKHDLVKQKLLKKLRKNIKSHAWTKRYLLVEAYSYAIEAQDKDNLIKLINDENTIISLNASNLNNTLRDPLVYETILMRLQQVDQATRSLYVGLLKPYPELKKAIQHILNNNPNSLIRKVCFDIIYYLHMENGFYDYALKDIEKSDRNCQLAAIRILGRADPIRAQPLLFTLLASENWLIRNAAVQSLADINRPGTAEKLYDCLNDDNYWIRVNAAKALVALGKEGEDMLNQYKDSKESQYKEVAGYFLGDDYFNEKDN